MTTLNAAHQLVPTSPARRGTLPFLAGGFEGGAARMRRGASQMTFDARTIPARVLVVIPDELERSQLRAALAADGFEVIAVASAEDAAWQLQFESRLPAVVVSELSLPGEDGLALCERIRSDLGTGQVPFLLISRGLSGEQVERALGTGADDCMQKPLHLKDVVTWVRLQTGPRALDGRFHVHTESIPLSELLRAMLAGVRSGVIQVTDKAKIAFRRGEVIDAGMGSLTGHAAIIQALAVARGALTVQIGAVLVPANVALGLEALFGDAAERVPAAPTAGAPLLFAIRDPKSDLRS